MIIAAVSLLNEKPKPSGEEIREGMNNNLCRCCGYAKIIKAVERAAGVGAGVGGGKV
jgi:aerobic-type carbon monoxide dehydrogenase small subunit (CoxS/CutS family)